MILIVIICVTFLLFVLLYSLPDSRISAMQVSGGGDLLDSVFEYLNAGNGFFPKYLRYCYNVFFHLNFGTSQSSGYRIAEELSKYLRTTLIILFLGFAASLAVGIAAGVFSATHKNTPQDRITRILLLVFSSVPSYIVALILAILLVLRLKLLPMNISVMSPRAYIMPTLTIAIGGSSSIARMIRASFLDVLEQPYIMTLRAKGLKKSSIIFRHSLKNAMIPIASTLRGFIASLLCGTFVVEHFFNVQGLGLYMLRAINGRSHFEILGCIMIITLVIALLSIAIDILYAFVNPQVRVHILNSGD